MWLHQPKMFLHNIFVPNINIISFTFHLITENISGGYAWLMQLHTNTFYGIFVNYCNRCMRAMLKLGSHRGDKLFRPSSSLDINVMGSIKGSSSNHHRRRWVGKDVKIKYASSNFNLYLYHMKSHFPFLQGKKCAKAKYLKSENSLKN